MQVMRSSAKRVANAFALVLISPAIALYWLTTVFAAPHAVFPGYAQFLSLIPGTTGIYLRRAFYSCVLSRCGQDVCICFGTVFSHPTVALGDRVYIGVGCMIGDATLEDDVLIGSHVSIINGRRQHGTERLDIPVREQPGEYPRVIVGCDTWIGDRAVVTTDIGMHSVVGAAAVVVKPVADYAIVVGNPATTRAFRDNARTPAGIQQSAATDERDQESQIVCDNLGAAIS